MRAPTIPHSPVVSGIYRQAMEAIQTLVNVFVNFFSDGLLHAAWW